MERRQGDLDTHQRGEAHRAIQPRDGFGVEQVSHYVTGIATAYTGQKQFVIGAIGIEVGDRIKTAYGWLADNYNPGDELFLFGFSRGAFEARSLGGFIALFGIGRRDDGFSFEDAWELYRKSSSKRDEAKLASLRTAAHYPARIKCVGVWDTVGNLGNPLFKGPWSGRKFGFHDLSLHDTIDAGLQALSIDEVRGPFRPTLWTIKKGAVLPAHQRVEQVWFAGTHADVGGGWAETELSDIPLLWMAERASAVAGLSLDMEKLEEGTKPNPLGLQHSATASGIYRLSGLFPFIRLIGQAVGAIPLVRRWLLGSWRTSKLGRDEASVNERVHESVLARLGETVREQKGETVREIVYRPSNLVAYLEARQSEAGTTASLVSTAQVSPAPKLVMIHGTGAGDINDAGDRWWQKKSEFQTGLSDLLQFESSRAEIIPFHWDEGANSEEARRKAGVRLYEKLKGYDEVGVDYHLIGHSHGGSVIYSSLIHSVARGNPLTRLKSWVTVGTPFLDYKPNRFLFSRLSLPGLSLYIFALAALLFALGLIVASILGTTVTDQIGRIFEVVAGSASGALVLLVPIVAFLFFYVIVCFLILFFADRLRGGWRSEKQKEEVRRLYEDRWLGIWHRDDEAISALANVRGLKAPVIPTNFLAPAFSMIPLIYTVSLMVSFLLFSASLLQNPSERVKQVLDSAEQSVKDEKAKQASKAVEPDAAKPAENAPSGSAVQGAPLPEGAAATTEAPPGKEDQATKPGEPRTSSDFGTIVWLLTWLAVIVAAATGIFLAITAASIWLFKRIGRLVGWPLARAIDKLVWSSIRQQAWGDDKAREGVASISSHPPLFKHRFAPLPDSVGNKLSEFSDKHAITTLKKVREILGMSAAQQSPDARAELSKTLNWRELIHTSYFDIPECTQLMAAGLHRAGLCGLKNERWTDATKGQIEDWLTEMCPPRPAPPPG